MKLNVYQAFWLMAQQMLIFIVVEIFMVLTILTFINERFTTLIANRLVAQFTEMLIYAVFCKLLGSRIERFIKKNELVKNYQIIYPIVFIFFMLFFCIFLSLALTNVFEIRVSVFVVGMFSLFLVVLMFVTIFLVSKYYLNQNEIIKMKQKLSLTEFEIEKKSIFEKSVEHDMLVSGIMDTILDQFEVNSLVYQSSQSTLYLLEDRNDSTLSTLKVIKKYNNFEYKFDRLKSIIHPNIASIHLIEESAQYHYVVKPYVKGETLVDYVREHGPFDFDKSLVIFQQIQSVLDYLHSQAEPIIYRDLSQTISSMMQLIHK